MTRFLAALLVAAGTLGDARANPPLDMHYGGCAVKMSREECARKAVASMVAEKFPFAEVAKDGNVRGWNDKAAVLVLSFPTPNPDQTQILVLAACTDTKEAGRLRTLIQTHIAEGKDDPKGPTQILPADGKVPAAPISICWKSEERSITSLIKHFVPAATIVMEKQGMNTRTESPNLVLGAGTGGMGAVFLAPSSSGVAVKLNTWSVTLGDKPAEKLAEDLLARVVKVLYD